MTSEQGVMMHRHTVLTQILCIIKHYNLIAPAPDTMQQCLPHQQTACH